MDDGRLDALGQTIVNALPGAAIGHSVAFNQLTVTIAAENVVEVVTYLRDDPSCRFINITDITAVDYPGRDKRFDVIYHFLSPTLNARIRLRGEADETTQVDVPGEQHRHEVRHHAARGEQPERAFAVADEVA